MNWRILLEAVDTQALGWLVGFAIGIILTLFSVLPMLIIGMAT